MSDKYSNPDLYVWAEEAFRPLVQETSAGAGKAGVIAFHFARYREIGAQKSPAIAEHLLNRLEGLLRETMRPGDKLGRLGADTLALLLIEDYAGCVKGARRMLPLIAADFRFPVGVGLSHSAEAGGADLAESAAAAASEASRSGSRGVYVGGREGIRPLPEADAASAAATPPPGSLLAARYQQLALLNRISLELFSDKPHSESMTSTCRIIMALMNCRYVSIHLCDDFGKPVPSFRYGDDVFAPARSGSDAVEERAVAEALAERRVLTASKGASHWRAVSLLPSAKPGPSEDGVLLVGYLEPQSPNEDDDHVLLQIRRLLGNAQFLRKNEERRKIMVAVTEQSADAILVTDLESRVIICNPSAEALFQRDKSGMLGRSYGLLIADEQAEEARRREREALRAGGVLFESMGRLGGGGLVPVEVNFTPLKNEKGAPFGMVCVFRDITRRKEVDRMKTEFVALVSHELRTPLTAIQGFAETIFDFWSELKPEELKRYLGIILDESKRLGMLVTNFLDISRLESGTVELNCREFELQTLTGRLTSLFVDHPSQAVFKVEIEPGSGVVYADEEQLYRVLLNLCGNALKYSPPKGTITISCRRSEGMTEISVSDQGPGIPPEHRSKIFDKFYRVADPISQKTPGTGLGLAICQGIVANHGGKILVESAPGRGTSFKFTLRTPPNETNTGR